MLLKKKTFFCAKGDNSNLNIDINKKKQKKTQLKTKMLWPGQENTI
jgi:hypothetical protein